MPAGKVLPFSVSDLNMIGEEHYTRMHLMATRTTARMVLMAMMTTARKNSTSMRTIVRMNLMVTSTTVTAIRCTKVMNPMRRNPMVWPLMVITLTKTMIILRSISLDLGNTLALLRKQSKGPTTEAEEVYLETLRSNYVKLYILLYQLIIAKCKQDDQGCWVHEPRPMAGPDL
jgi:hypothetical protein